MPGGADGGFARLLVVYDADGSLVGEVSYIVGHALGLRECAACDITHRPFSLAGKPADGSWEKPEWRAFKKRLPMPVEQLHRDELSEKRKESLFGRQRATKLPLVAGERNDGSISVIVTADQLSACHGKVSALESLVINSLDANLPPVMACSMRTTRGRKRSKDSIETLHTNKPSRIEPKTTGRQAQSSSWGTIWWVASIIVFIFVALYLLR